MRAAAPAVVVLAAWLTSAPASADDEDVELYARVIVDSTPLRTGPGASFRRVHVAERGDVFRIRRRSTIGYWFQVELPDGTTAWVLGDAVYNHEVGPEGPDGGRPWPRLFAPPPLPDAAGEIAVAFGVLGRNGFMAVRPSILLAPEVGIELTAGAGVSRGGRMLMGAAGGIVNVFPDWPIVPYVVAGGGFARSDPNADTFLLEPGTVGVLYGGGGLRLGFRYRLTVRIEARVYGFFEPDRYVAQEEFSGGVTVFF